MPPSHPFAPPHAILSRLQGQKCINREHIKQSSLFMAVEAHLHLLPAQLITNREGIVSAENQRSLQAMQTGFVSPTSTAADFLLAVYNAPAAVAGDSSLTDGAVPSRKRPRPPSFLGDELSCLQQQMLDMDRLIAQHAEEVRAAMAERRRRLTRQVLAVLETSVAKRLKAKEEEIARIGKLNWALEERVKSLCAENQMWRDLAQSSETTARVLRANLEQVLVAQARADQDAAATADDAESCCSGNETGEVKAGVMTQLTRGACRRCRVQESSVLLLPCRHLCLCVACAPAVDACPVCNCEKNGSVNVNLY